MEKKKKKSTFLFPGFFCVSRARDSVHFSMTKSMAAKSVPDVHI